MLARNTENLYVRYNWKGLKAKFFNDSFCYQFSPENLKTGSKYEITHCLSGRLLNFFKLTVVTIHITRDVKLRNFASLYRNYIYVYMLHIVILINTDYFS
jgi:methyltransferase-like protein